jgi:hypothetical protein
MSIKRLSLKLFVENPEAVDLDAYIPLFHRWIQQDVAEELLIDVADYRHVHNGPGVILVAHEADYALNMEAGRPGLLYTRKRSMPDTLGAALALLIRQASTAALRLQQETDLRFRTDELEIAFLDRLNVMNTEERFSDLRGEIEAVLSSVYSSLPVRSERISHDAREPLTVRAIIQGAPGLEALAQQASSTVPA